ncbi:hypothetical protein FXN80_08750 [Dickeya fangzhongdai]|nr:hypothetical protein [Dickeya fangzhongdai]UMB78466.1 hypothetical protein FXN80_08750 [Dickeya fangzhongdai]
MSLAFNVTYPSPSQSRLKLKSVKKNTGPDARAHAATSPKTRVHEMSYYDGAWHASVSESTSYHGLHHMTLTIIDECGAEIDETIFSIYIK